MRIGFFGVSVESDTGPEPGQQQRQRRRREADLRHNPGAAVPDGTSVKINEASNLPILKG